MRAPTHILTLTALATLATTALGDKSTSANYAMAISIDAGGQRVTSASYTHNITIAPISGRSVATRSDVMNLGFASQLNNPPVAIADVTSHPLNSGVNFPGALLAANDFDPDGDVLSVVAVDPSSASGGTITLNGQTISYLPPDGLATPDHFQYTIADSNGDTATATVTLGIAPDIATQPINTVAIVKQPDGKYFIRFKQQPGFTEYIVQYSHDLNDPNWQTLSDVPARDTGIVEALVDPTNTQQTFFRAVAF